MNTDKKLNILLVNNMEIDESCYRDVNLRAGHIINILEFKNISLEEAVNEEKPDVLVLHSVSFENTLLSQLKLIISEFACPIIVFTENDDRELMKQAIESGISAYVVNGWDPKRLMAVIETAIFRFNTMHKVQIQLLDAQRQLDERKLIEKAKGIIMKQSSVDEEVAYKALRNKAMNQNIKLIDLAKSVITTSELMV